MLVTVKLPRNISCGICKCRVSVKRSDDRTPKVALASRYRRHTPIFIIKYWNWVQNVSYILSYLSISLSVYLSICLSLCLSIYPAYLSVSISLSIYLSYYIYLSYLSFLSMSILSIYLSISPSLSVFQWSTCYPFPVAIFAGLLRRHILNSSASSPSQFLFPLPVFIVVVDLLPVTRSLFAKAICYPACVLHVLVISTCFPFSRKLFYPHFFLWLLHLLLLVVWKSMQLLSKNPFLYVTVFFSWYCIPVFWSYPLRVFSYY